MFDNERLSDKEAANLKELARQAKGDILTMTRLAGSGHPGGSMSSLDVYLVLFSFAHLTGKPRDRIVVSHGHTSPGVYASLARLGHMPAEDVVAFFRKGGSPYEGHVVKGIPFVDWSTGNLGQGLSAGCGFAIASKLRGEGSHVYVLMGDGEQQKGQIAEARRFAVKYGLNNITAVIDYNGLQISGSVDEVMPQNVVENFLSDGWDVLEVDGHDHKEIYSALRRARMNENVTCIVARTVMGKGVPFMENKEKYHGSPVSEDELKEALTVLDLENRLDHYKGMRGGRWVWSPSPQADEMVVDAGEPFTYTDADKIDNRTAFGKALKDLGDRNIPKGLPVCAFDCDLASSVKTSDFAKAHPDHFFQGGIQEHNTATAAGALSSTGILTFFADFGVFGIDETYNQQRLNDINKTNLKLIITHVGLDVGPDGKTHQCTDYIGLVRNLYGFRAIVPADPNQTDRAVRYTAAAKGNCLVATGRNRWPVITGKDGKPLFAGDYTFIYGAMDLLREGRDGAIVTYGGFVTRALSIAETLSGKGISLSVVNMPCVLEVDDTVMERVMALPCMVTYEDHNVRSGIGPILATYLLKKGYRGRFDSFGATRYGVSGETEEVLKSEGLDVESMVERLSRMIS